MDRWNLHVVITVPANSTAFNVAQPSAGTMLTTKLHVPFQSFSGYHYFHMTFEWPDDMIRNGWRDLANLLFKGKHTWVPFVSPEWYQINQPHSGSKDPVVRGPSPVPLTVFWSNSKCDQNLECSSLKYAQPITTEFCTGLDSCTVVTCAKCRCDR